MVGLCVRVLFGGVKLVGRKGTWSRQDAPKTATITTTPAPGGEGWEVVPNNLDKEGFKLNSGRFCSCHRRVLWYDLPIWQVHDVCRRAWTRPLTSKWHPMLNHSDTDQQHIHKYGGSRVWEVHVWKKYLGWSCGAHATCGSPPYPPIWTEIVI